MGRDAVSATGRADASTNGFVAREWVDERVDAWLGSDKSVLVLSGPPGTGKTELARHVAHTRPEAVYTHFCRAREDATLEPGRFVADLAQALAAELPPYAAHVEIPEATAPASVTGSARAQEAREGAIVAGVHMPVSLGEVSARPAFDRLVRRPLERLASAVTVPKPMLVIVDALDEALTLGSGETLVHLLQAIASPRPPIPLQLLLTSRRDPRVLGRLRAPRLDLLDDAPAGADDVRRYAERRLTALPSSRRRAVAERIAAAAAGNFLYARYVLDELLSQPERLRDLGHLQLPAGLDEHYHDYLARELARSDEAWEERYRLLLGLLAIARGDGLSRDLLIGAGGIAGSRVDDALRRLGQYLEGRAPEGPFRIYHQSFRDFLATDTDYGVYPDEAEQRLTDHLLAVTPTSPQGERDWSHVPAYARTHLANHAAAAGQLDSLLEDAGYLVTADPLPLLRALPTVTAPTARLLRRAYRHVAHLLAGASPRERAAYLEMAARQGDAQALANALADRHPDRPWSVVWARWSSASDHFTAGRHDDEVNAVAVGELHGRPVIVSSGSDWTVRVWELADGTPIGDPITDYSGDVTAVAVGELDGRPVIIAGSTNRTLWVWELADGTPIQGGEARWPAVSGPPRRDPFSGHNGPVRAVAVGELDGRPVIISGGNDGTVRLWNLADGTPIGDPITGHKDVVTAVAVGGLDGRPVIISGGWDRTVRVWELADGAPIGDPITGHTGRVGAVAVGELDGRPVIISGGNDETVRVWELADGTPIGDPITGHDVWVHAVAVGELDGRPMIIAGSSDGTVRVWELADGAPIGDPLTGHEGMVSAVAVGELDGRPVIISGGNDGTVRVWELADGTSRGDTLTGDEGAVSAVAVGELDGRPVIISGSYDGTVRVWELADGAPIGDPITGQKGAVSAVALGELDGRPVIISGYGGTVRVWELADGAPIGDPITGHNAWVHAVAVGELDGRPVIIAGSSDGTVRVWELADGAPIGDPITGHDAAVSAVAVGELDGRPVIVSSGSDWTVRVWELADGTPIGDHFTGHDGPVSAVAVGELDGRPVIVSGGENGTVRVWELADGTPIGDTLTGHDGPVSAVAVGELDGRPVIISGSYDGTVRVWELAGCRQVVTIGSRVSDIALDGRGHTVVSASAGMMLLEPVRNG